MLKSCWVVVGWLPAGFYCQPEASGFWGLGVLGQGLDINFKAWYYAFFIFFGYFPFFV